MPNCPAKTASNYGAPLIVQLIRCHRNAGTIDGDDLVRECYASDDFHLGVEAFVAKSKPDWTGR
jgi:enoyl-CoA hydratase